jgi:diguanylate cyclase (GGDEF)-like protein
VIVDSSAASLLAFLLGLAVTAGLTVPALLRLRSLLARTRAEGSRSDETVASLQRAHAQLEEDLRFLTQFLKDYPRLARELYSGLTERQIPGVLLSIVQRSLDPQQVVVLVRRADIVGERGRSGRLVVAAAYPPGGTTRVGTEVPLETGEIGFAADAQVLVSRQDLEAARSASRIRPGPALEGISQPDIIAPLVFDQETLGMILVQKPRKAGDPTTALRLVAQTGGQVLHTAATVRRMKTTAEMDGLTRVFNKKHLEQRLGDLIYQAACAAYDRRGAERPAPSLAVFLFDIDHFKNYNDTNGHLAGDRLLQELARLVNDSVRKGDVFGRFGGEEFLLIQPETDATAALASAEKLRTLVASHAFAFAEKQPLGCLSISGGVAEYPRHGVDAAGILLAADEALYRAKRGGRNRVLLAAAPAGAAGPPRDSEPSVDGGFS